MYVCLCVSTELSSSDSETPELTQPGTSVQPWSSSSEAQGTRLKVFDSSLLPKKNARCGYLYKQGGYKANKGWKKRWVVYNGTNLSYFSNDTTQVSKRIIPVRCMVSVETDIKPTDKDSFRFKVVTSLKDRIFVFSSETLDDCLTWANTLMAAVTEYKKSIKADEPPPVKPDIEGFIKFSNMKRYYVTITGKILDYYQSYEDFQMGSPTHEIDMKLASVKVKDHKKLQLWIYYGHFNLTYESDQEMQQWRLAIEDAIAEGLADDTVLKKVYENMSNQHCADCGVENPHWASINMGIVVCKNCAGVHRMFDYRVSKIRSLRMDTRVWTPSLIELMVAIGNANANAFWEFELPAGAKLQPMESMDKRKEFIFKKYKSKKFCRSDRLANQRQHLGEELLAAASHDNVLELMKVLFSGADVLYRQEEHGPTAYDVAKTNGQRLIMELLYQNGGDPQTLEQDVTDENRLREDVRLQGFLNKAGPVGKGFEKRWCILEHGTLSYYQNEKSKTFKGSINRKDMYMIQAVENDRISCSFELSTGSKDNRIFTFISESRDDCGEWIRTIAKLMAPVPVMEQVGMIDVKLAGYAYMKESLVDDWHQTFIVFSWRGIYFMNRDLRFDHLDLRKASGIKMQDSSNGYQQQGPCFVISSTGRSVYLQATLIRDTERMYTAFLEAVVSSGPTIIDQALTSENVPVIVEKCITHIYMNGLEEKGIYRVAGQNSRVQSLLDEFRKDVWSVSLSSYTVQDVSNVLKRFLRELDDSVFGRLNYSSWINMAGCKDVNHRLMWYKYYLEKLPQVNFQTLKRIILHLLQVSQHENHNLMSIANLASCFAPSLMRTAADEQPVMVSDAAGKEISIMVDLLSHSDYFFNVNENEKIILNNIKQAEKEIQKRIQENRKSVIDPATGMLIPVHMLSREGQSLNVLVTEEKTAKEAMDYLRRNKAAVDLGIYVLHEQLFKGALERPLFPEDIIAKTTNRWMEWESWVMEDNNVCLCVQGLGLLERLSTHFSPDHSLLSKHQYCDSKPKSKFKRRMIGFRQYKLAVYNDSKGVSELVSWRVEDITVYLGSMPRRTLPPHRYCLTFIVNGEKYVKPPFGHCLSFETEQELYRWASALYAAQHPAGLLSWASQ
ncbi:hypothetical protein BsWGS_27596 [Bradybaena similaris]